MPTGFFGLFPARAFIIDSLDEMTTNDTGAFFVAPAIPADSVVINEIMFNSPAGRSQWIELYNRSKSLLSMDSTRLLTGESKPGTYSHLIPSLIIPPDSFGIVTANDSILTDYPELQGRSGVASLDLSTLDLGKDSCTVVLHNIDSTAIDSVHYLKSWQQSLLKSNFTGISLERKDPNGPSSEANNWRASQDLAGATPLRQNSVDTTSTPNVPAPTAAFLASFSPDPFSPDGDGVQDNTTLTVQTGNESQWALRTRIYDAHGRMVRLLADAMPVYRTAQVSFDGKRDNGQTLPPGIYTVLVELTTSSPVQTLREATGVVIAGKRR
jgi:hypothetical protein